MDVNNNTPRQAIEQKLKERELSIQATLNQLKREFSISTEPIEKPIREHPTGTMLAALVGGLVVGYILKGSGSKRSNLQRPVETLKAHILSDIERKTAHGQSLEQAVREALELNMNETERFLLASDTGGTSEGPIKRLLMSALQTALRTGLSVGLEMLKSRFKPEES